MNDELKKRPDQSSENNAQKVDLSLEPSSLLDATPISMDEFDATVAAMATPKVPTTLPESSTTGGSGAAPLGSSFIAAMSSATASGTSTPVSGQPERKKSVPTPEPSAPSQPSTTSQFSAASQPSAPRNAEHAPKSPFASQPDVTARAAAKKAPAAVRTNNVDRAPRSANAVPTTSLPKETPSIDEFRPDESGEAPWQNDPDIKMIQGTDRAKLEAALQATTAKKEQKSGCAYLIFFIVFMLFVIKGCN